MMRARLLRAGAGAMVGSMFLPWGSLRSFSYVAEEQLATYAVRPTWHIAAIGIALALLSLQLSLKARVATAVVAVIGVLESLPAAIMLLASSSPEYAEAHVRVGVGAPISLAGALVALGAALWPERRPVATSALASGTS